MFTVTSWEHILRIAQTAIPSPCTLTPFGWYTSLVAVVGIEPTTPVRVQIYSLVQPTNSCLTAKFSQIVKDRRPRTLINEHVQYHEHRTLSSPETKKPTFSGWVCKKVQLHTRWAFNAESTKGGFRICWHLFINTNLHNNLLFLTS